MKRVTLLTFIFIIFSLNTDAQSEDYTKYLELALKKLQEKDCETAQKLYNIYTDLSHKQVSYVETLLEDCNKENEKNSKRERVKKQQGEHREKANYSEGKRPFILLSSIFAFNASHNPQLSWGLECGLIWGNGFQGGLTFKFRSSFGYYSQKYAQYQNYNYSENSKIRKDYYNGIVGVLLGSEFLYCGISMGYAYRVFVSPDNSVDNKSLEINDVSPLKGFAGEIGLYATLTHGVFFSISVGTIRFKYAECVAGLGYRF